MSDRPGEIRLFHLFRCRRDACGYTVIEVLLSLTVLAIGAAGVIGMQRAAIQGNLDARRLDTANALAREWVERLRKDTMLWTLPSQSNPGGNNFSNATLLNNHVDTGWYLPNGRIADNPVTSPGFNLAGEDLPQAQLSNALFCTSVRLTTLIPGQLLRAEVRVFWPRMLLTPPDAGFCTAAPTNALDTAVDKYHFVYAATALRENPAP